MQPRSIITRIAVAFAVFAACLAVAASASAGVNLNGGGREYSQAPAGPNYAPKLQCETVVVKDADGSYHAHKVCQP